MPPTPATIRLGSGPQPASDDEHELINPTQGASLLCCAPDSARIQPIVSESLVYHVSGIQDVSFLSNDPWPWNHETRESRVPLANGR